MSDANYYDRFSNNQQQETPQKQKKQVVDTSAVFSITKVFMYMFVGLLITAGIALGLGAYFGIVLLKVSTITESFGYFVVAVSEKVLPFTVILDNASFGATFAFIVAVPVAEPTIVTVVVALVVLES